jgi:hypothetical protein
MYTIHYAQMRAPVIHSLFVFFFFDSAYERSHRVFQEKLDVTGPYYITIGDGGNREGLSTDWLSPQPVWSAFRQASYGHGELTVFNSTHMHWDWHQNPDVSTSAAVPPFVTHALTLSSIVCSWNRQSPMRFGSSRDRLRVGRLSRVCRCADSRGLSGRLC